MNFQLSKNDLSYTSFNQSKDCVIFGTNTGFYVYTINPFKKIIARKIPGGVSLCKMLYKSNIIVFVGLVDKGLYPKKKLIIWDDNKRTVIGEIIFKKDILNIKVTKDIIIVVTYSKIYVYNFKDLKLIKSIETSPNPKGLCVISSESFIAYPGEKKGQIEISKYDQDFLKIIDAHVSKIEIFKISNDSKYLISCSERGTLIRIFSMENGEKISELRRGSDQVKIVDLKISTDNNYILCSSSKGTIHIFSAVLEKNKNNDDKNLGFGWGISYINSYLPQYFSSEWSFSQLKLPDVITYSSFIDNNNQIITIGDNGCFYEILIENYKLKTTKNYKFISDEDDPFSNRTSTIK
jgi:WD repeat-containing protein 45